MRTVFGFVALLVVLAALGSIAVKQLRATGQTAARALPPAEGSSAVPAPGAGTVREQAQALNQRVQGQVGQALQQGAAVRGAEAGK